jgi:DNA repair protein SbcC/Rad50
MKEGTAKRYYKKINTTFEGVNKVDDFAKQFINLLESAKVELYQKERRERRVFDDSWMDAVEDIIPIIDKLTRAPRETLKKISQVVPVERAKKIDSDTIRHLAANTQLIKYTDQDGNIIPSKVLTSYLDSDLGTYENRFLMSLVNKLYTFVELRYDLIIKKMHTEYVNYLKISSEIDFRQAVIDYDITFRIHQNMEDDEIGKKNQELLNRMTTVRDAVSNYKMSIFMRAMSNFAAIRPPIMKTNVIRKNPDFSKCYDLWVLLDQVDRIGYEVDVLDRDVEFNDEYLKQIENAMMVLYATVANNQVDEFTLSHDEPFDFRKSKKPKVLKKIDKDDYIEAGEYLLKDDSLNQYFLDQIRKDNIERYKTLIDAGIPEDESVKIIHQRLLAIADGAFKDFINYTYKPGEEKDLENKIRVQNEILSVYRDVEKAKRDNIKNLTTQKALALLDLKNYREELKKKQADEKAIKDAILAEEKQRKLDEEKAKAMEKLAKKRKVERAQKVLQDAKKARKLKKQKEKKIN